MVTLMLKFVMWMHDVGHVDVIFGWAWVRGGFNMRQTSQATMVKNLTSKGLSWSQIVMLPY